MKLRKLQFFLLLRFELSLFSWERHLQDCGRLSVVRGCSVWCGMCGFVWWVGVVCALCVCVWRLCRVVSCLVFCVLCFVFCVVVCRAVSSCVSVGAGVGVQCVFCLCVWCCACACGVWCVARLNTRKTSPCVDSKRLRVHDQDVSVCTSKTPAC